MAIKFGSLFTGIGGFDLAFENAGMECAWQAEIDKNCLKLLGEKFPNARRYTDVREITRDTAEPVDLICGGFPCQDLSVAGKRKGLAGERSGLWFEFHRILAEHLPRWVVIENVPGLLSSNSGEDFAVILRGLVELRYGICWRVLDAQYFGVAQRRRRVFIVGSLGDGSCAQILFEPESGERDTPPSREAGESVATNARNGTPWDYERQRIHDANGLIPALAAQEGRGHGTPTIFQQNTRDEVRLMNGDGKIAGAISAESGMKQQNYVAFDGRNLDTHEQSPTIQAKKSGGYSNYQPMVAYSVKTAQTGSNGWGVNEEVMNTLDSANGFAVAYSLNSKSNRYDAESQTLLPVTWDLQQITSKVNKSTPRVEFTPTLNQAGQMMAGVRRLTPTECERLMGFPDGWTAGFADSTRYRMLGNAVAVPVVEWIGKRVASPATT